MENETTPKAKLGFDTPTIMAIAVTILMVVVLIVAVVTGDKSLVADTMKTFVGPGFLMVLGYYYGSSASSRRKDETIAAQAVTLGERQA